MAYKDLREFIKILEEKGLLKRIRKEVSADLEITEIIDRVVKKNGPALLFENVRGYRGVPVLANAFGTLEHMNLALEVDDLEEIGQRIQRLLEFEAPSGIWEGIKKLPELKDLTSFAPKYIKSGPCKEVILREGFSIEGFPVLKCWPGDGGRFITLPLVFTKNRRTGKQNVGMYRMQVYDGQTTGMHWHIHKHGARDYEDADERIEVAVAIGADPATVYSATAPLPDSIDEMMFAGFLRKKNVELVRCETADLYVPAHAEIVLEGYVDPGERRVEGPFGDHTGYYSLADDFPVFHITCITHRKDPVYHATVVGIPPMEDAYLGKATERIFLPLIKAQLPEIVDINLPVESVFHNLCIVSIKKRYPGHAKKVMFALWGMGQMMFTKIIIVLDDDVNVQDMGEVLWAATTRTDPARDVVIIDKAPTDTLDHASPLPNLGSKMGIDATQKGPGEGFDREWPEALKMDTGIKERVDGIWDELGLD